MMSIMEPVYAFAVFRELQPTENRFKGFDHLERDDWLSSVIYAPFLAAHHGHQGLGSSSFTTTVVRHYAADEDVDIEQHSDRTIHTLFPVRCGTGEGRRFFQHVDLAGRVFRPPEPVLGC